MAAERNAERTAVSIDDVQERAMRKTIAQADESGTGMRANATDDGRWVNTIVLTFPIRLASDEATSIDTDTMMEVKKKRVPSEPSGMPNFTRKKYVTQDLLVK